MFKLTLIIGIVSIFCMNIKAESWSDAGNYNISWYTTDPDLYVESASELAGIAYITNNNFSDFSGQTIHIMNDIDLNGKTWVPIGHHEVFKGSINGHGHTITGMNIDSFEGPSGLIGKMIGSNIQSISISGSIRSSYLSYPIGILTGSAARCNLESVRCNGDITIENQTISTSTAWNAEIHLGGLVGYAQNCNFSDDISDFNQKFIFGKSGGYSCFGYVKLYAGGMVGYGTKDNAYLRCESISSFDNTIYGFNSPDYYSVRGSSAFFCGGIVGKDDSSSSTFTSCLSEIKHFNGSHLSGNYDNTTFYVEGFGTLNGKIENSVAIIDEYNITGHDYSWVAAWYHTYVYLYDCGEYKPSYIAGCYINNDISKTTAKINLNEDKIFGSSSFSKKQMNSQSFIDELNFYSRLHMNGIENWEFLNGKLSLKHEMSGMTEITDILTDQESLDEEIEYYTLKGIRVMVPTSHGIYIRRQGSKTTKVII